MANVRFGSKADMCSAHTYFRFGPIADIAHVSRRHHDLCAFTAVATVVGVDKQARLCLKPVTKGMVCTEWRRAPISRLPPVAMKRRDE